MSKQDPGFTVAHDPKATHPTMNEVRDVQIRASLALKIGPDSRMTWEQSIQCLPVVKTALLQSVEWRLKTKEGGEKQIDFTQPFDFSVALVQEVQKPKAWEGTEPKTLHKVKASCFMEHADSEHDRLDFFFNEKLSKLFWSLKKTFNNKGRKANYFQFVLGFSTKEESASLDQLRRVVQRVQEEKTAADFEKAGLIAVKPKIYMPN